MSFSDYRKKQKPPKKHVVRKPTLREKITQARIDGRLEARPPGRVTKLCEKSSQTILENLARGQTLDVSASMAGIHHSTLWTWIRAGQAEPDGPYGKFARDVAWAQDLAQKFMVTKLFDHDDWRATAFLLKNRWPNLYRDHIVQEMQGPHGGPIPMAMQTFSVVLELHERQNDEQPRQPEPAFRIDGTARAAAAMPDLEEPDGADT
jgi:hypothetical protein